MRSRRLQGYVLRCHERALANLLRDVVGVERIGIVGGGLFPRTAIILSKLMPGSRLTVIDLNARNLETASEMLPAGVKRMNQPFDSKRHDGFDLLVFPLSLQGERREFTSARPRRWTASTTGFGGHGATLESSPGCCLSAAQRALVLAQTD